MYDSNWLTFWKRQNNRDSKMNSGCQKEGRRGEVNRWRTRNGLKKNLKKRNGFLGVQNTNLYDSVIVIDLWHYTF